MWGWRSSSSATCIGMVDLPLKCTVPTSASVIEYKTPLMVWHSVRIGQFGIGVGIIVVSLIVSLREKSPRPRRLVLGKTK